jgi:NACalpha-BTF3-like transcription factor
MPDSNRDILMQMGFSYEQAQAALDNTGGDLQEAGMLLAAGLD